MSAVRVIPKSLQKACHGDMGRLPGRFKDFLKEFQARLANLVETLHAADASRRGRVMQRQGDRLAGCEDWFLGEARFRRRFVSGADVFHKVPEERLGIDYLAKRNRDLRDQLNELDKKGRPVTVPRKTTSDWESSNPIMAELRLLARKLRYHYVLSRAQRRTRILRESQG